MITGCEPLQWSFRSFSCHSNIWSLFSKLLMVWRGVKHIITNLQMDNSSVFNQNQSNEVEPLINFHERCMLSSRGFHIFRFLDCWTMTNGVKLSCEMVWSPTVTQCEQPSSLAFQCCHNNYTSQTNRENSNNNFIMFSTLQSDILPHSDDGCHPIVEITSVIC